METNIEMHNGKYQCHTPASRTYHLPSLSHSTWACMAYWICLFHILIKKMVENFLQKKSREWTIRKKRQDRKSRTRQKNESGDRKRESHDSPASPDRKVPRHPSFPLHGSEVIIMQFQRFHFNSNQEMPNIQEGTCCFSHPVNQDGCIRVKQNINPRYQLFQLKTVMDSIMFLPIIIHITTEHWTKK